MSFYRRLRARAARAGLHRPVGWLRNFGLDEHDVLLASHGRSGNTMLRFVLAEILSGVPSSFDTIQRIVPEVGLQVDTYPTLPNAGRLIKTHEPYCREYKRAIYIVRDVRDVILSSFARETAVGCMYKNLDEYIVAFLQGRMSHWGSWQSHVESWVKSPLGQSGDLLVLRFEDMRKDLEGSVVRCLEFLGKPVEPSIIRAAVRNNSVAKMRAKEQQSRRMMKISGDGRQVNTGAIERWRNVMSTEQLEVIDEYAGDTLLRFGYPRGSGQAFARDYPGCATGPRWAFSNHRVQAPKGISDCAQQVSLNLEAETHPAANRALRIRLGGRIANLFSWYAY